MKYTILERNNIEALRDIVKFHLNNGWKPLGGICAYYNPDTIDSFSKVWYCQALIKHDDTPQESTDGR